MAVLLKFPREILLEGEYIILKQDVSDEEFWEMSNEDSNYELIDGVLIIHSPASEEHEDLFRWLSAILSYYIDKNEIGKIYGSRFVMRLGPKWNPEPDLMIILQDNYDRITSNYLNGPADIAIEIISKSTRDIDLGKKLPKYLEAGVREVWLLDPERKNVSIISSEGTKEWNDPTSTDLLQSEILPGLTIQINWIWNRSSNTVARVVESQT